MDLRQYDGQCVRITVLNGDIFDGVCTYKSAESSARESGRCEEGLQIIYYVFYKSDIKSIESLENHTGPYGKFRDPYGKFEVMTVESGIDSIIAVLFCDDNEHVMRLLNCLDRYFDPYYGYEFPCHAEAVGALCELLDTTDDEDIKNEAEHLIETWKIYRDIYGSIGSGKNSP